MRNTKNWMAEWDQESHLQLANLVVKAYMKNTRFTDYPEGEEPSEGVVELEAEEFSINDINAALVEDIRANGFSIGDCSVKIIADKVYVTLFRSYLSKSKKELMSLTDESIFLQARSDERKFSNMQEYLSKGVLPSQEDAGDDISEDELEG